MAVDHVGRHAGSWRDIQGSTRNYETEVTTNDLGWILYPVYAVLGVCCTRCMLISVYAVLGVCCTRCMLFSVYAVLRVCCTRCMLYLVYAVLGGNSCSCHGEIERDDLTVCSAMMVEMWMRKSEMGDEDENDVEDTSGYDKSGVRPGWLGWEVLVSVSLHAGSRLVAAVSGMVNWLAHKILSSPSFSWWFVASPLPSPKITKLSHRSLSLHAMIKSQPGSRSIEWGWEVMILPGGEDSCNCVDLPHSTPESALQSLCIMRWCLSTRWSALQSRSKRVPNEPIPTYGPCWPQCHSVRSKYETDRVRRNRNTAIGWRYAMRCLVLTLCAEQSATGVSPTTQTGSVHSDRATPPQRKSFLLMHWEELIDFIEENCGPKEACCVTALKKCNSTQEELAE